MFVDCGLSTASDGGDVVGMEGRLGGREETYRVRACSAHVRVMRTPPLSHTSDPPVTQHHDDSR
jgi:hypothetical protein